MFYHGKRRFNIYRDFHAKDILLSDTSFDGDREDKQDGNFGLPESEDAYNPDDMFSLNNINATMGNMSLTRFIPRKSPPMAQETVSSLASFTTPKIRSSARGTPLRDISNIQQSANSKGSPLSSIHLSEFVQPPRSTSTPNEDIFLSKRPTGYSAPLFRFDSRVLEDSYDRPSSIIHDTNESLASLSVLSNFDSFHDNSPLAPHNRDRRQRLLHQSPLRSTQHNDGIRSGSPIAEDVPDANDLMQNDDYHISEDKTSDDSRMLDTSQLINEVDRICGQSMSDLKFETPGDTAVKKRVRINDDVEFIDSVGISSRSRKRPQPAWSSKRASTPRKKRLKHKVNPETDYDSLLKLCGENKDPLALIRF